MAGMQKEFGLQAGLPRTGTNSLMKALEILGYGPCHHTETIANEHYPYPNSRLWQQACLMEDRWTRQKILRKLYEEGNYRSACDYIEHSILFIMMNDCANVRLDPTAMFIDDLVDMYPQAKFVHGVRSSAQEWRKSVNETVAMTNSSALFYSCFLLPPIRVNLKPLLRNGQLHDRRRHNGVDVFEPSDSVEIYHRHNEWVRTTVPTNQLLEFNPANGWKPLCDFLGVPVPKDANGKVIEYPRTNDKAEYKRLWWTLMAIGFLSWLLLFGVLYGAVRFILMFRKVN